MMRAFEYVSPATKVEAVHVLDSRWGVTEVMAGGSDLLALMKHTCRHSQGPRQYQEHSRASRGTMTKNGLRVGALTRLADLAEDRDAQRYYVPWLRLLGRQPVHKFAMWRHSGGTYVSGRAAGISATDTDCCRNTPQARI